jgi:MYXO-CTERM domain-containing protein
MRHSVSSSSLVVALACATPSLAAVDLAQQPNAFNRSFENLPDLRLVRGAQPQTMKLDVTAEPGEAWTLTADATWIEVTPASGTGPATVLVRYDGAALALLDDPSGTLTLTGDVDPSTNTETLAANFDIYPNLTDAQTPAELRAWAKDPANWPQDGFSGGWQLWSFLPDEGSHGEGAGANMDAWEKTPCPPGQSSEDCVRDGQAGLAAGMSADTAWLLSTGDDRVVIAVLDSGIKWSERDLNTKHYINARELASCPPPGADTAAADPFRGYDVNEDGVFNIRDYDDATWLTDLNQNGLRDPQDLIWGTSDLGPCSDGFDDDGNGYMDDISGWDFFWNDNDPSDDTDFGHGTGEANDSGAEIHDGGGRPSVCPRCMILNTRVGDSFIVDVNQFADGTIFAVESGASLVQEALGSLNNTPYAQAAIDWAYQNGVPIVASAADETSYHHNYPGSLERTLYVHAIVADTDGDYADAATFLNFGNCTNFGGHLALSTPGTGCSSEATGNTSGHVGLFMSYFKQLQDQSAGTDDEAYYADPLSAEEVYQTLNTTADDIDVPGAEKDPEALAMQRFPSNEGWDLHFGYGRNNVRRSLEALRDKQIPVESDIVSPRWFQVYDPAKTPSFDVEATIGSRRLTNIRWELFVSEGVVGKNFTRIAEGTGAVDGDAIGSVSLSADGPIGSLVVRAGEGAGSDPHQFSATLELRTVGTNPDGDDVRGVFRKTFGVRHDPTTMPGFPIHLGASGESSPKLTDLDGDGREEIVVATSDGQIHAFDEHAQELPGFPILSVATYAPLRDQNCGANNDATSQCHRGARPFATGAIDSESIRQSIVSSIAVGDLNDDGSPCRDIVAATMDGMVYAFNCEGELVDGFPVEIDRTTLVDRGARRCETDEGGEIIGCRSDQQFGEHGFFSSPALTDLDGDGSLEIVIGGLDSWAYAWHADGSVVNGWPVHLENPAIPEYDNDGRIRRYEDRIIASPAVCDVFGDGTPMIFMGSNERVAEQTAVFIYGIWPDGNAHPGGPFPEGWPTTVSGFIPDEILPFVGRGNPNSPACADTNDDGKDEVINAGMGGTMLLLDENGDYHPALGAMAFTQDYYGPDSNVDEAFSLPVINNPSVADLNGDGHLEIINGTAGSGLIQVASAGGLRAEFDHSVSAWETKTTAFAEGFPHRVWDYQFFMNYAVADLEGTGKWNVISGDGGYFVYAPNVDGKEAEGFPKWTQGWHISTPALGDLDGDSAIDVVASTREGDLWAWKTKGHVRGPEQQTPAIQWEGFHHDDHNTGNAKGPLKKYEPLAAPDDAAGCGCSATEESKSSPLVGVALVLALGTLVRRRKRA